MTTSGFRVRVTGLVFVFKSASLTLKQVPTCIGKPKTNTFDKSHKFLHWLFLVVLDGFRSFLDRFRSFWLVLHFSKYLAIKLSIFTAQVIHYSMGKYFIKNFQNVVLYFSLAS